MSTKKKALFLGDYTDPGWHPAKDADKYISKALEDNFKVKCTEDYGKLAIEELKTYDLIINYADCWGKKCSKETIAAIITYVVNGGGILSIHNGILVPAEGGSELRQLFGARFTGHSEYKPLDFYRAIQYKEHPILKDFAPFTMGEEPYEFEMDTFADLQMLLEYRRAGQRFPAVWARNYGLGRMVYLVPGHDNRSFEVPAFQKLITRSAEWLTGILD
jgi:type 1 glutamine amidotransferase